MPETTYLTTDTELTGVADAIRERGGTSESLEYPDGFVSAIRSIPTGGGDEAYNIRAGENTVAVAASCTVNKYQIVFYNTSGLVPFTNSNTTNTGKTLNTHFFDPNAPIYVYTGDTAVTAGNVPDAEYLYTKYSKLDLRYATNCATTLTAGKAVYIRVEPWEYGQKNLLNCQLYTTSGGSVIQTFPTTFGTSYPGYYMRLGTAVSDHEIEFDDDHPIYRVAGSVPLVTLWDFHLPVYGSGYNNYVLQINNGALAWMPVNTVPTIFPSNYYEQVYRADFNNTSGAWFPSDGFANLYYNVWLSDWTDQLTKTQISSNSWEYKYVYSGFSNSYIHEEYEKIDPSKYYFVFESLRFYDENEAVTLEWMADSEGYSPEVKVAKNNTGCVFSLHDDHWTIINGTVKCNLVDNAQDNCYDLEITLTVGRNTSMLFGDYQGHVFKKSPFAEAVGGSSMIIDTALSSTSTNPVENRAIYSVIGDVESLLQAL